MKILSAISRYTLYCFICNFLISCNSEIKDDTVQVDSTAIKDSIKTARIEMLVKQQNADYFLDSLYLGEYDYTIDAQKVVNKKVLIDYAGIEDIYQDNNGFHLVLYENHCLIRLICSAEQVSFIRNTNPDTHIFYLTMQPDYVKKVNLRLVSNVENDGDEETPDKADIAMERFYSSSFFKINGKLVDIKAEEYNRDE